MVTRSCDSIRIDQCRKYSRQSMNRLMLALQTIATIQNGCRVFSQIYLNIPPLLIIFFKRTKEDSEKMPLAFRQNEHMDGHWLCSGNDNGYIIMCQYTTVYSLV